MNEEKKETIEILGFEVLKPDTEEERLQIEAMLEAALRDSGESQAQVWEWWAALTSALEKVLGTGFQIQEPPPGWTPPRQRMPTEGFYRRQIAQVRSGEIELPDGADRQAVAKAMEEELDRDVAVMALAKTFLAAGEKLQAEIDARVERQLLHSLDVYHQAKAIVAAEPDHPAAFAVKQLDKTLRMARGRGKSRGTSRGKAKMPKGK